MMDKKVSVIVPVYNVEKYLDRCMKSITQQTYKNMEIILVDDGAKDKSGAMCDAWSEEDSRVMVIHQKNGGLSNARNTGIKKATGEYLIFVDSDDVIAENMVEHLTGLLEGEQADISMCGVYHIFSESNIRFEMLEAEIRLFDRCSAIKEMWYQKSFLPSAWGKAFKRQLFGDSRFTEGILFEDIDLMYELFWKSRKIVYQNIPMYGYVHRENSITTAKFSKMDCGILQISEKLLRFAKENESSLIPAAESYAVTAAFRIYLNTPHDEIEFGEFLSKAEKTIRQYGKIVMKDREIRKKTKYALILYFYCKPLLVTVYKRKNRWK
ncbi:glycosyltransferase family 2 protein [Lachnospiraceae bacterium 54-53]